MATKIYQVQPGQSLSIIARDVLGDMERWKEIAYVNSLQYPYIIKVGQIIRIPDDSAPPLVVEITKGVTEPNAPATQGSSPKIAGFSFSPATVILLVVGAFLLLGGKK